MYLISNWPGRRRLFGAAAVALAAGLLLAACGSSGSTQSGNTSSQGYGTTSGLPTAQTLTFINRFGVGGGADLMVREIAKIIHDEHPGVNTTVQDISGANSLRGITAALTAPANGYTVLEVDYTVPLLPVEGNTSYTMSSFDFLGGTDSDALVYAVPPGPLDTGAKFLAYARTHSITIATTGIKSSFELALREANHVLNLNAQDVGFATPGTRISTVLGGHTTAIAENWGALAGQFKSGKLVPVVILKNQKPSGYPNLEDAQQLGVSFTWGQQRGFAVKAGTPSGRVTELQTLIQQAATSTTFQSFLNKVNENTFTSYVAPAEFTKDLQSQTPLFKYVLAGFKGTP